MAATNDPENLCIGAEDPHNLRPRQNRNDPDYNPYAAFTGIVKDSSLGDEADAYWMAERQREREEAARQADLEDAQAATEEDARDGQRS